MSFLASAAAKRKNMNETTRNGKGWRILRWILIGLAVLATLVAVLVTEENWRGKRVWENYKRQAAARGEKLDWTAFVPANVPDEQNFFAAPIVAGALSSERGGTNRVNRMDFIIYRGEPENWPTNGGNWHRGKLTDLNEWQRYFRTFSESTAGRTNGFPVAAQPQTPAADILLALSGFNPAIEDLRQASQRPYARMPLDYASGFEATGELLPWLANVKRCSQLLQLRTLAELENGQSDRALDGVKLLLGVTDSLRHQPFLISHLVRIAMLAIALQPIYEGLAQHRWSDAQLVELEHALAKLDLLADFEFTMQGEKVFAIDYFEKQRITREIKSVVDDSLGTTKVITNSLRLMPGAYFYQNELTFAQMHRQWILPLVDLTNRIAPPAVLRQAQAAVQAQMKHYSPYKVQALMLFPAVSKSVIKFAYIQSAVDLARVACALERYRLAHGEFPGTLDALAPQFIEKLPHDVINGQPLHYRRTDDGQFVLSSVGWDEKDDGGQNAFTPSGSMDREKGDWVWQYPAK
jgi:hypothetical protein